VKLNSHTEASSETATHTCMIPPKGTKYQTVEVGDLNHPYAVLLYQVKNIQKLNVKQNAKGLKQGTTKSQDSQASKDFSYTKIVLNYKTAYIIPN